jgi:hypothetical protein
VVDLRLLVKNLPPSHEHKFIVLSVFYALLDVSRILEVIRIDSIEEISNTLLAKESFLPGVTKVCRDFETGAHNKEDVDVIVTLF